MVVEHLRGHEVSIYRRFRERGRQMPEGLRYVSSWVQEDFARCFQLMETEDRALLDEWIAHWKDLADFEVQAVMTSAEAAERIGPKL
jgi:hypothetical protein